MNSICIIFNGFTDLKFKSATAKILILHITYRILIYIFSELKFALKMSVKYLRSCVMCYDVNFGVGLKITDIIFHCYIFIFSSTGSFQ